MKSNQSKLQEYIKVFGRAYENRVQSDIESKSNRSLILQITGGILVLILTLLAILSGYNIYTYLNKAGLSIFENHEKLGLVTVCFITSVGSILVYLSFIEQIRFNEKTFKELKSQEIKNYDQETFNNINSMIIDLTAQLNDFKIVDNITKSGANGIMALEYVCQIIKEDLSLDNLVNPSISIKRLKDIYNNIDFILLLIGTLPDKSINSKILITRFKNATNDYFEYLKDISIKVQFKHDAQYQIDLSNLKLSSLNFYKSYQFIIG